MSTLQVDSEQTATGDFETAPAQGSQGLLFRRIRTAIIGVLVVAAAVAVWDEVFKYRFIAKRFGVVVDGKIYRSGQISKWMIEPTLKKHDIQVVVDLTSLDPKADDQKAEIEAARKLGVEHLRFPMGGDGVGTVDQYADVIKILHECEQQSKPVLVHCAAGAQRTGGVVASYRLLVQQRSREQALEEMRSYGWSDTKNAKLLSFLDGQMDELARKLVAKGVLEEVPQPLPVIGNAQPIKDAQQQAAADDAGDTHRM